MHMQTHVTLDRKLDQYRRISNIAYFQAKCRTSVQQSTMYSPASGGDGKFALQKNPEFEYTHTIIKHQHK